jgi:uncharacterized protein (TIGR02246 family)
MTNLRFPITLASIVLTASVIVAGFAATSDDDAQTTAIHALVKRFVEATNAKDVKAFGSVFAEDGEFTNPVGMSAKGRTAIEQFHAALFSESNRPSFAHAHLTITGTSVRFVRSDVASVDVKWEQTGAISPEGKPWGARRGILSWIVTQDNGKWLIAVWHNLELPSAR